MAAARLLIIDDEVDITMVMKKSLEMAGFAVGAESDPIEAFRNFRAGIYDLVILDIRMLDVDGIDLYGKLREIDRRFKACFISTFVAGEYEKLGRTCTPSLSTAAALLKSPRPWQGLVQIVKSQLNTPQR